MFFYPAAALNRLKLIQQNRLNPPKVHGLKTNYDNPFYSERITDRLYIWGREDSCLGWAVDRGGIASRFRREVIKGAHLYYDPAFPGFRRRVRSYYTDASVPANELKACGFVKWSSKLERKVAVGWVTVSEVDSPTIRIDLVKH